MSLAGGELHSLALRADGAIVAWGENGDGQSDVPAGTGFIHIAAGREYGLALTPEPPCWHWSCSA